MRLVCWKIEAWRPRRMIGPFSRNILGRLSSIGGTLVTRVVVKSRLSFRRILGTNEF